MEWWQREPCCACAYTLLMSILFVFLDGLGLAPASLDNPLADAPMPALQALLGGPLVLENVQAHDDVLLAAIDATLGVPGLPQSGTGQTALFGGFNAAALHGRHQPAFPPVALRPLLAERSILRRVMARGEDAAFANVFTPGYWQALEARRLRRPASVIAAEGAGVRFRDLDDLRDGRALAWDITGGLMRTRIGVDLPLVAPHDAGAVLARLARTNALVLFESFLPDLTAHGRVDMPVAAALAIVDGFLGGILAAKRPYDTLVVCSDHGNIESRAALAHTRNPVPLLVVGPGAALASDVEDITGVADGIMRMLAATPATSAASGGTQPG